MGINFRICGIAIDPGLSWRFWCRFWRRLRAVWAISGSRHQPRRRRQSVNCDLANVNKRKLWRFDRRYGCLVISSEVFYVGNVSSLRDTMVRVHGNWRCHQLRNNSRNRVDVNRRKSGAVVEHVTTVSISQFCGKSMFCTFISPSIFHCSISNFSFYFLPTPTTRWASKKNQYLTPAALGGKEFRWAMHEPM